MQKEQNKWKSNRQQLNNSGPNTADINCYNRTNVPSRDANKKSPNKRPNSSDMHAGIPSKQIKPGAKADGTESDPLSVLAAGEEGWLKILQMYYSKLDLI